MWQSAALDVFDVVKVPPLSLLIGFFSASAAHGRASASLCFSETSIMVSYSWIVACWSSCEMDSN